jgi:hypothetical protein
LQVIAPGVELMGTACVALAPIKANRLAIAPATLVRVTNFGIVVLYIVFSQGIDGL